MKRGTLWVSKSGPLHSLSHFVPSCYFNSSKKGLVVSTALCRNLDKVVNRPMSLFTSFKVFRLLILMIDAHLSRLVLIALQVSMNTRNFPPCTLNMHFSKFSLMLYFLIFPKIYAKYFAWDKAIVLLNTMLSTYISKFLLSWFLNILSISLWFVAPAFLRLNDITK